MEDYFETWKILYLTVTLKKFISEINTKYGPTKYYEHMLKLIKQTLRINHSDPDLQQFFNAIDNKYNEYRKYKIKKGTSKSKFPFHMTNHFFDNLKKLLIIILEGEHGGILAEKMWFWCDGCFQWNTYANTPLDVIQSKMNYLLENYPEIEPSPSPQMNKSYNTEHIQ